MTFVYLLRVHEEKSRDSYWTRILWEILRLQTYEVMQHAINLGNANWKKNKRKLFVYKTVKGTVYMELGKRLIVKFIHQRRPSRFMPSLERDKSYTRAALRFATRARSYFLVFFIILHL